MPGVLATGHDNYVSLDKVLAVSAVTKPNIPEPLRRSIEHAKSEGKCIDHRSGKRLRALIHLQNGFMLLSSVRAESLVGRWNDNLREEREQWRG